MDSICPYCNLVTSVNHEIDCPNNPLNHSSPSGVVGWTCPVCGRGVAPWQDFCNCEHFTSVTKIGTAGYCI